MAFSLWFGVGHCNSILSINKIRMLSEAVSPPNLGRFYHFTIKLIILSLASQICPDYPPHSVVYIFFKLTSCPWHWSVCSWGSVQGDKVFLVGGLIGLLVQIWLDWKTFLIIIWNDCAIQYGGWLKMLQRPSDMDLIGIYYSNLGCLQTLL